MRLAWPVPRHLIVPLLISISALAVIHLSPTSLRAILSPLALILVFLVPGYLALIWACPAKGELSRRGRGVLSLAASVLLAGLLGLLLYATPRGLQSGSLATLLALVSIFLFFMAYLRWSDLPRNRRFFLWPRSGLRPGPNAAHQGGIAGRRTAYAAVILAVLFIAALALSLGPEHISWGAISSRFDEPLPDLEVGMDQPLFTLTKDGRSQVGPAANASPSMEVQSPASRLNRSGSLHALATNSSVSSSPDNASPDTSEARREISSFGGGGGSASVSSSKSQSKKASEPPSKEPQETKTAPPKAGDSDLPEGGNISNQSYAYSPKNQSGDSTSPLSSDKQEERDAIASDAVSSGKQSPEAVQTEKAESYSNTSAPDTSPQAIDASSSSDGELYSASLAAAAASSLTEGQSASPPDDLDLEPITTGSAEPFGAGDTIPDGAGPNAGDANLPPVLESLTPDRPSPQPPGTAIFWRAKATDYDEDKILYKFLIDGREANKWSRIGSWSWLTSGLSPGDYEISALVRDGNHASESSFDHMINVSFALVPLNRPPIIEDLISERSSPMQLGESITWRVRAVDPDNDTIYYRFLKDGQEAREWSPIPYWIWNTTSENAGQYSISVQAKNDGNAPQESFDSSLERRFELIPSNGLPEISELRADLPSPQPQGSAVIWTADALDREGDAIYYKFLIDGLPEDEWSTSNSWTWNTSSAPTGIHSITVQARDGEHASGSSFDSSKEVAFEISPANQAPILASLQPDVASPQAQGATVNWTAGAADREGDQIFYKFLVNGRDMTGWLPSSTWMWSTAGLGQGDYRIRAMVRDGGHAQESSFDDYMDSSFSLISEIDLQIERLQRR